MTYTKIGSEFCDECEEQVSPEMCWWHLRGISWLYHVLGGREEVSEEDLLLQDRMLTRLGIPWTAMEVLAGVRFWLRVPNGWLLRHHASVVIKGLDAQRSHEHRKALDASRKRNDRAKARAEAEAALNGRPQDSPPDGPQESQTDRQTDRHVVKTGNTEDWRRDDEQEQQML